MARRAATVDRDSIRARRAYLADKVNKYKAKTPCADCGEKYPSHIMEFDHVKPELKRESISWLIYHGHTEEEIFTELKLTECVCSNCHKDREFRRKQKSKKLTGQNL